MADEHLLSGIRILDLTRVLAGLLPAAQKRVNLDGEMRFACARRSRQRRWRAWR